jgi:hypothetical protein
MYVSGIFYHVSSYGALSGQGLLQVGGGDFTGVVRLASSTEAFAESDNDECLAALQSKHLPPHSNTAFILLLSASPGH